MYINCNKVLTIILSEFALGLQRPMILPRNMPDPCLVTCQIRSMVLPHTVVLSNSHLLIERRNAWYSEMLDNRLSQ